MTIFVDEEGATELTGTSLQLCCVNQRYKIGMTIRCQKCPFSTIHRVRQLNRVIQLDGVACIFPNGLCRVSIVRTHSFVSFGRDNKERSGYAQRVFFCCLRRGNVRTLGVVSCVNRSADGCSGLIDQIFQQDDWDWITVTQFQLFRR